VINFNAYKGKDLQTFLSMLNQFESDGVSDIRFVRERIQRHIDGHFAVSRPQKVQDRRERAKMKLPPEIKAELCPSCGRMSLMPAAPLEGLQRVGCKHCGYSAVIGEAR